MTDDEKKQFFARAELLGHDKATLLKAGKQATTVTANTVDDLKKLMQSSDPKAREKRQATIESAAKGRELTPEERLESFLHGTGTLSDAQRKYANGGFPMKVSLVSEVDRTMPHGETVIGPSTDPTVWNYGTLNFYADSYLTVQNTVFTLNVTTLVMQYTDP